MATVSRSTIAHLLHERMAAAPDRTCFLALVDGKWRATANREALQATVELAAGLWSRGVRKGDRVAVMSASRPEWALCDGAALSIGAVVVSIYPTSTPEATARLLSHSGATVAIVEDGHLAAAVAARRGDLPELEALVVVDGDPGPADLTLEELRGHGRRLLAADPSLVDRCRDAVAPDDPASLMYTSGTTGDPKGVVLTHRMLHAVVETLAGIVGLEEGDVGVVYLPMSHILQRVNTYLGTSLGLVAAYAPAIAELVPTCRAVHPRAVSGVPRVFEKIHAAVMAQVHQVSPPRRALFSWALAVGRRRHRLLEAGRRVPLRLAVAHALAERLVLRRLRRGIFGDRIEYLSCGAAPIAADLLEFFWAVGLPIYEGYGLTETSSPITYNRPDRYRIGTVGPPLPGSEVKIADDGEVLMRGPSVFVEYFRDPEATAAAFTPDGWFRSGDLGELDADGFLRITGRKKDLIITAAGKNVAPAPIERRLLAHPLVGQAVVVGDRRPYLTALLALDPEATAVWARRHGRSPGDVAADDPELLAELDGFVAAVNGRLARYETIKRYRVVPEGFHVANGLLTPTLKVRRRAVLETHADRIDAMYAAAPGADVRIPAGRPGEEPS